MVPLLTDYNLPFSHNTAQLAYHSALWPFKVIQGHRLSWHLNTNMRLPISEQQPNHQQQPKPYLEPFNYNTSVTGRRQRTDSQMTHRAIDALNHSVYHH